MMDTGRFAAAGRGSANLALIGLVFVYAGASASAGEARWYKGNTHTHTWWSDGDSPPEVVVKWYKEHGYNFLVLSDHNVLSEGERWLVPEGRRVEAAKTYEAAFDSDWVVKREGEKGTEYRLKPLNEFRALFEDAGQFLMIQGEEISDAFEGRPVHVNGVNLKEVVIPPHGGTMLETMQNNIDAVLAQRERTGQPMFPHLNHPNFKWSTTAEDIMHLKGEKFFEVYNGHSGVRNYGDEVHASTERMWDIVLTKRLAELGLPVMYGVATDDAHAYTSWGVGKTNPGRGWVMVRSPYLTPEHVVLAMERGDFYASTGVVLNEIRFDGRALAVEIKPRDGVTYRTQFIGTLEGYDASSADRHEDPKGFLTRKYSEDIGRVLAEREGTSASYTMTGKEIYVRAKVISSAPHPNPFAEGDVETAWVQPVQPEARRVSIR